MPCEELDIVWNNIKAEARALADCEPMLASFYHATLLKHENLGSALSYMLANKLASSIMPAIAIREVVEEAYAADPEMIASAACDIQAVRTRDPAVDKYSTPLLYLKGFHALQAYRIGHWLWNEGRRALAIFLQNQVSVTFQVDIHPAAKIGRGIMLDHATGIVVGETAVIEDDVSILQSVTLGGTGKTSGDRHPKIREGVMIGAGAKILGNIEVGRGAKIGAGSVVMPFGGKYQKTPADGMAAKFPVRKGETDSASFMAHGFDPDLATWSPFHGAVYAVLLSVTRLVAMGADWRKAYLTLQEYFEKLTDKTSWGKPAAALLGAFHMQEALGLGAIGGKDSMSGTFNDIHVPPTLVSFAIAPGKASEAVSQELKKEGDVLVLFGMPKDKEGMPDLDVFKKHADFLYQEVKAGHVAAMKAVDHGGVAVTAAKMAFGNGLGIHFTENLPLPKFFGNFYGAIIVETTAEEAQRFAKEPHTKILGTIGGDTMELYGESIALSDLLSAYEKPLDPIFPRRAESIDKPSPVLPETKAIPQFYVHTNLPRPRVFIPTMPGNNCEVDSARAFERAGAVSDIFIFRNRDSAELKASVEEMAERISHAQIVMFPGGFSGGDEPDGSGKFIAAVFRNDMLKEAMDKLLHERDGLALGICNGFQALIKLGLVPYGEFKPLTSDAPTLTFNTIGRHLSRFVTTKVVSTKSPWLSLCKPGDLYSIAISHGEGCFIASDEQIKALAANGQIATQYTDFDGNPTYDSRFNPNGSSWAVEGITSPDGRVLGKMGHTERRGDNIAKNICGNKYQPLFEAGVKYFQGK